MILSLPPENPTPGRFTEKNASSTRRLKPRLQKHQACPEPVEGPAGACPEPENLS
jgi:hypothetical protein